METVPWERLVARALLVSKFLEAEVVTGRAAFNNEIGNDDLATKSLVKFSTI